MQGTVKTDLLFLGLTRPPMLFGVSYAFLIFSSVICMVAYIISSDFRFLVLIFPVHAVGYYMCGKEPLFIELFIVKIKKCPRRVNTYYHRANSYDTY